MSDDVACWGSPQSLQDGAPLTDFVGDLRDAMNLSRSAIFHFQNVCRHHTKPHLVLYRAEVRDGNRLHDIEVEVDGVDIVEVRVSVEPDSIDSIKEMQSKKQG